MTRSSDDGVLGRGMVQFSSLIMKAARMFYTRKNVLSEQGKRATSGNQSGQTKMKGRRLSDADEVVADLLGAPRGVSGKPGDG